MSSSSDAPTIRQIIESISLFKKVLQQAKLLIPLSQPNTINNTPTSSHSKYPKYQQLHNQLEKLVNDLVNIERNVGELQHLEDSISGQLKTLQEKGQILYSNVSNIRPAKDDTSTFQCEGNIEDITEMVTKLKLQIPSLQRKKSGHGDVETVRVVTTCNLIRELLKIRTFQGSGLEHFEENYENLDSRSQHCLLCFSVFPEDAVVEKTFLTYWWIGEGLIDRQFDGDKREEEVADEILKNFLEKGFIKPVLQKRKLIGFKVHKLIRYVIMFLAEQQGLFNFDFQCNPTVDFSRCRGACLVKTSEVNSQQLLKNATRSDLEKLQTLINVNDDHIDLRGGWLSRMSNLNVLCLGKSYNHFFYVRVEGIKFLKGLQNVKHLKFLSFRGINNIYELPDSICKLNSMRILELKECMDLTKLLNKIESLQKLTHLDVSERWYYPKNKPLPQHIGSLVQLQVLKGFAITELKTKHSATLDDLTALQKLRKLSIGTNKRDFPTDQDLNALYRIKSLRKLTILWHRFLPKKQSNFPKNVIATTSGLPEDLKKLDLRYYPETEAPSWLMPHKLKCLKYLYFKYGNLENLGQAFGGSDKWNVKILRLFCLAQLRMDWAKVQEAFPKLIYLENNGCPWLTSFPCDEDGVWLNREMLSEQSSLKELEFKWSFLTNTST